MEDILGLCLREVILSILLGYSGENANPAMQV